ncbi:MAG: alpha/beta hydrolase-fold protein [Bacteroidota bacterium]
MQRRLLVHDHSSNDERPVYVVGSFNDWQPGQEEYRMEPTERPGYFRLELDLAPGTEWVEYKYTRGGWDGVELDEQGGYVPNRRKIIGQQWRHTDHVSRWAGEHYVFPTELLPKIEIIDEEFAIPQLIRTRRIAALLPHDYYESDKRYPVLYLQDGQNLFEDTAPFGSWGVDKRLARLSSRQQGDIIIVAIDHAEAQRMSEFTPSFSTILGRGEGKKYVRFLADTLKPYVDQHFRTLPDPPNTGIGGSSLGGLVSIYAGLMYPEVYDKFMIFSPSLWVTPELPWELIDLTNEFDGRIYLYGGAAESATMVEHLERFRDQLLAQPGAAEVKVLLEIDPLGQHNEARWGQEFPRAIEWLFFDHQ